MTRIPNPGPNLTTPPVGIPNMNPVVPSAGKASDDAIDLTLFSIGASGLRRHFGQYTAPVPRRHDPNYTAMVGSPGLETCFAVWRPALEAVVH